MSDSIKGNVVGFVNFARSNPDYEALLTAIAAETDPTIRQGLVDRITYDSPLSRDEIELFEYCEFGYIQDNPGYNDSVEQLAAYILAGYVEDGYINIEIQSNVQSNVQYQGFTAYVGEYYNNNGETT